MLGIQWTLLIVATPRTGLMVTITDDSYIWRYFSSSVDFGT